MTAAAVEPTLTEHQVVVVFDVTGPTRQRAAHAVLQALVGPRVVGLEVGASQIQSWWFPEADLKALDGNDNTAMELVPVDPDVECPQCKGSGELSDGISCGDCPICRGTGEITAGRATELDNSGWCTNTGRAGLECGYLTACPECRGA